MRVTILQPPYRTEATLREASICLQWMFGIAYRLLDMSSDGVRRRPNEKCRLTETKKIMSIEREVI